MSAPADRATSRSLRQAALVVCAGMAATLALPWSTTLSSDYYRTGRPITDDEFPSGVVSPTLETFVQHRPLSRDPPNWTLFVLLGMAAIHGLCLSRPRTGAWDPRLLAAGLLAAIAIPLTIDWDLSFTGSVEPRWGLWAFCSLWLLLLTLHLWWLPAWLRWVATGPRRTLLREVASVLGFGLAPALLLCGAAMVVGAWFPGALGGGRTLLVPAPIAIALSAYAAGLGLAVWFRVTRPGSPAR